MVSIEKYVKNENKIILKKLNIWWDINKMIVFYIYVCRMKIGNGK